MAKVSGGAGRGAPENRAESFLTRKRTREAEIANLKVGDSVTLFPPKNARRPLEVWEYYKISRLFTGNDGVRWAELKRTAPGYNTSRQAVDNLYFVPDILIKK